MGHGIWTGFARISAAALLGYTVTAMPALAAQESTSFTVSMTVQKVCSVQTTAMAFGVYTGAQLNGTGTVTVTCTNTTAFQIDIDYGMNSGGQTFNRTMIGPGGALLPYQVYKDGAHMIRWGGTSESDTPAGCGNGNPQVFTAYGQVMPNHLLAPGAYTDTLTVAVYY